MSLKDWFGKGKKGDWVRVGTDGKIKGDCAREPGEGKPKCMPRSKAHSMSKKDRATSAMRKRRKDPVVDRPGTGNKPINVKTDVKEKCWDGWKQMGMKKKGKRLVPNCVKEDKPSGKASKPYSSHGIPKDATKAELKAIRSNPNSSKGKKQLAHWKLNMHKEEKGITKKEKYMMTGRHLFDPKQGLQLEAPEDKGLSGSNRSKMDQLFRMGLIAKDERQLLLRALKRGDRALKDPLLRKKLYELLRRMMKIVTDDQQIYRQFRQHVQNNKVKGSGKGTEDVQESELIDEAVSELFKYTINKSFEVINISEDMSGMSVSSGHKRSVAQGAGMTKKGVNAYKRRNPGSKLKTAVTTAPSKLKPGSKPAKRRKAFCSRSRSWTSDRGKAARRRWNC